MQQLLSFIDCNWTAVIPGCVTGANFGRRHTNKTLEECKQLCEDNDRCKSIEYGVDLGQVEGAFKTKDCQLNSDDDHESCDASKKNLVVYVKRCGYGKKKCSQSQ